LFARNQRGLFFGILTPLRIIASIFQRLSVSRLRFSYSEALQAPLGTANTPFRPNAKTLPLQHPVFPCIFDTFRLHPDAAGTNRKRSIALRMARNSPLPTATSAI
jgi:hypothetical protein